MINDDFRSTETFKLGIIASNCSGGMTSSYLEDQWSGSWEKNLKLAQMADKAGIDFILPAARFIGLEGKKDFQGTVLETITWASALLSKTENIKVFATMHTSMNHPIIAAKQIVSMAQIGKNRIGLNIVSEWDQAEYDALGIHLPEDHKTRYDYAQEWFDLVKKIWKSTEAFNWEGQFFQTKGIYGKPNLKILPPIFNAAGSKEGKEFAVRNSDFLFTPIFSKIEDCEIEIQNLKKQAAEIGKNIQVLTCTHIICRRTEDEAKAEWDRQLKNVDQKTVQHIMDTLFAFSKNVPPETLVNLQERVAIAFGGYPLVGTPEQIADGLSLLHKTGFAGSTLYFFDYTKEFPYFRDYVMPILREKQLLSSSQLKSYHFSEFL
ncbi:LLM class flavin-dependent oxidoreductase [Acinetobacter nosocomialis]|uniref:LLM class flavin-dependent oxidoreductase n=1 Tax=Acinetobacter nosocomialis TaxID=106654 RepID=UPI001A9BEE79|nr:LLM class flavin-dependent oxidoreductase [Acinetobacter nosocomialis]MBO1282575.1 LLM class flavin-dependent oxidoreductase [Acinetobacter nosocomialis]